METLTGVVCRGGVACSSSSFATEVCFDKLDRESLFVRCHGKKQEFGKSLRLRKSVIGKKNLFPRNSFQPPLFIDRSHEQFYGLHVVCGKKEEKLAKIDKLREMLRTIRRYLQPLQGFSPQHSSAVTDGGSEVSTGGSLSNPAPIEAALKQLADIEAEIGALQVKSRKKKGASSSSSSSSSSSESSESDPGMDMRTLRKSKPGVKDLTVPQSRAKQEGPGVLGTAVLPAVPLAAQQVLASSVIIPFQEEEEPEIVAQIRALCNSANVGRGSVTLERRGSPRVQVIPDTPTPPAWPSLPPAETRQVEMTGNIEVCMGKKCKRGGAQQLLESFQENIPEASNISVTSCKCMGKCKTAANIRVQKDEAEPQLHSRVLQEDVGTLLELHFGLGNTPSTQRPVFQPELAKINSSSAVV